MVKYQILKAVRDKLPCYSFSRNLLCKLGHLLDFSHLLSRKAFILFLSSDCFFLSSDFFFFFSAFSSPLVKPTELWGALAELPRFLQKVRLISRDSNTGQAGNGGNLSGQGIIKFLMSNKNLGTLTSECKHKGLVYGFL